MELKHTNYPSFVVKISTVKQQTGKKIINCFIKITNKNIM